jgi:hypothetical protein
MSFIKYDPQSIELLIGDIGDILIAKLIQYITTILQINICKNT